MPAVCSHCGTDNRDAARFCGSCGSPLARACTSCGEDVVPGARFCDACGTAADAPAPAPAASAELRKTVTILFADLVGSTSLQETLDTESVRRVMSRFYDTARAAIEAHKGVVIKFTGDGVMAAFGTPVVREDDALRGVRAAHALVAGVAVLNAELQRDWGVQLRLRTGVNTGEVIVGGEDGDLIGDPVNVAARLEQAAADGEVLVGEQTERLVRRDVQLEPVAPLDLKGKADPVPAFRLVGLGAGPDAGPAAEVALVGRDDEFARLRAAFDDAVAVRAARLVTVIGSPGIGKSRLADELARSVVGEATVLEGRSEPTDGGITFAPVAEVLRAAAGIGEGDSTERARGRLTALLPEGTDRDTVAERALGVLGAVPAASTEETFWGVRRVLEAIAGVRPLVLILDDVHWGQPTYLDLIEHLVEWVRDVPLLILVLARPELRDLRDALVTGRRAADVIELDPLGAQASRTLVDELLGGADLPTSLAERILGATEGNPLFVAETVRMLVDEGVLTRTGDTWVVAGDSLDVEMPPTIHALIAARLERLGGDERAVVERASVIGKHFYRGAVAELCSNPIGRAIDGHLETLRRKELVQPDGTYWIDEPVFRFHHVLIRDAAYRSVLKEARAELHERFADWLESKAGDLVGEQEEVVAFHLEQAHQYRAQLGPLDDRGRELGGRAAERLASAGRRALAREDLPAAANLLGRALARLSGDAPQRPAVLVDLAETLLSAGDTHAAQPVVEALTAAAGDERLEALASVYAAQLAFLTDSSTLQSAVETAVTAAERLTALGDHSGAAKASHVQAGALAQLGRVGATEAALDRALASAREAGDQRRVSAILAGAPLAALWGPSSVVRASGRCLDVVRILRMTPGNSHLEAAALSAQAVLEAMRGRPGAARRMLDGCRATFEELGLGLELLENEVHAGIVELLDGDAPAAESCLRIAYDGFAALGTGAGIERAEALLARALLDQDRDAEADALTRAGEERGGEDLKATIAWCGARAQVLARRGDHANAQVLARRGAELAAATDALTDHADALLALAAVLRAAGDEPGATVEAQRALALYTEKENVAGARRAAVFAGLDPAALDSGTDEASPERVELSPRSERLAARFTEASESRDAAAFADLMTDDLVMINHRSIATWDRIEGPAAWGALQQAIWDLSPDVRYAFEFVAGDEVAQVVRGRMDGHWLEGGGAWTLTYLAAVRLRGDQVEHSESFDEHDEAAAIACADRLRAEAPATVPRPVGPPPTQRELAERYARAVNAGDWEALRDLLAEDVRIVDRRLVGWGELEGREAYLQLVRTTYDLTEGLRVDSRLLMAGRSASVVRLLHRGRLAEGGGEFEIETLTLSVSDPADGGVTSLEIFDGPDAQAALARFAEVGAASEPERTLVGAQRTADARDWDGFEAWVVDDVVLSDYRVLAWEPMVGREAWVGVYRTWAEMVPDVEVFTEVLAADERHAVIRHGGRGHAADGGGAMEYAALIVNRFRDGRLELGELFADDDEAGAMARYEELRRVADPAGGPATPRELLDRYVDLCNAHDIEALRDLYTSDLRFVDRRLMGWAEFRGPDEWLQIHRGFLELGEDITMTCETLITGRRASVARRTARGRFVEGGGDFEIVTLPFWKVEDGRISTIETFSPEDVDAALARFEEVGAASDAERVIVRYLRRLRAQDWDGLHELYVDDAVLTDRRLIGWEPLVGPEAIVAMYRSWVDVAPDIEGSVEILGDDGDVVVGRFDARGHAADGGGAMEYPTIAINVLRDGRFAAMEIFAADDEAGAMARYEELRRVADPAGGPATPRELFDRYVDLCNARDIDALADLYLPDVRFVDRRLMGWAEFRGTDEWLQIHRGFLELGEDMTMTCETLVTGRRAGVGRFTTRGRFVEGGGDFEVATVTLLQADDGRTSSMEMFSPEDVGAALARFEEVGAANDAERLCARFLRLANARDWAAASEMNAEDYVGIDHRTLGWDPMQGPDAAIDLYRSWVAMVPDMEFSSDILASEDEHYVYLHTGRGHAADSGGAMEYVALAVTTLRDGRAVRSEIFADDDLAGAMARYEELRRGDVSPAGG